MATDTPNRLLAMLNSATSPPTSAASGSGLPGDRALSPSSGQAVSLADLFKTIAPAPPPAPSPSLGQPGPSSGIPTQEPVVNHPSAPGAGAAGASSPAIAIPPAVPGKEDQQNRLLGMLRSIGVSSPGPGRSSPALAQAPLAAGKASAGQAGQGGSKQKDLLAMFKSPSAATPPPTEGKTEEDVRTQPGPSSYHETPIADVPSVVLPPTDRTESSASSGKAQGIMTNGSDKEVDDGAPSMNGAAASTASPAQPKLSAPTPPPVQKSPFHFVSPFDAFDPPSRSVSQAAKPVDRPATPKKEPKKAGPAAAVGSPAPASRQPEARPKSVMDAKPTKEQLEEVPARSDKGVDASAITSKARAQGDGNGETPASAPSPAPTPSTRNRSQAPNGTATAAVDYRVGTITSGAEGKGPAAVTAHISIDVSKPNLDSLISDRDAAQIIPTANMKAIRPAGFYPGRMVGITPGWMAYGLSGGRIRLLDRASGSRIVLQLPEGAAKGPVVDIAVTPTLVAALGVDGSVAVFKVPKSWTKDDPPCQQVLHVSAGAAEDRAAGAVGQLTKVEWIDRGAESLLAVGGKRAVIIVDPREEGQSASLEELGKKLKVLSSEGDIVGFCFNHTQQAIAVLSTSSHLTIYSVATLNRVYHKQLPSSDPAATPSSVMFCETNILVGHNSNTSFDLVQITLNLAVLSSIRFIVPSSPAESSYSHAVYDQHHAVLWLTSFPRGSMYGFKYALKGKPPIGDTASVLAFTAVGEVPLEQVSSLVLSREAGESTEIIFAHPKGVSLGLISGDVVDALSKPTTQAVPQAAPVEPVAVTAEIDAKRSDEQSAAPVDPSPPTVDLPANGGVKGGAETKPEAPTSNITAGATPAETPVTQSTEPAATVPVPQKSKSAKAPPSQAKLAPDSDDEPVIVEREGARVADEVAKQLKKMEDRITTQFRQALSSQIGGVNQRIEAVGGDKLAGDIAGRVEKQLKGTLSNLIKEEMKKTVVPAISSTVQAEVRSATAAAIGPAVKEILKQTMPTELERVLLPAVEQSVSRAVQQTLATAVQDAIAKVVVPSVTQSTSRLVESLSADLRSEMVQLRKDLSPPSVDRHDQALKAMAESMLDLRRQLSALSEQIHSAPPLPAAPAPPLPPLPPVAQHIPVMHQSLPPPPPPAQQLEDTFLAALSSVSVGDTISLVNTHYALTDYCLPINPTSRPPLSQAVMLTLFHRLALALAELAVITADPMFARAVNWERRVAALLDPRVPEMRDFYPRVVEVVRSTLGGVINRLGPDPAGRAIREILDVVGQRG